MNIKARKYSVRALSVALAAFLGAGIAVSFPEGSASANGSVAAARPAVEDVTGKVSTDEIRMKYLNTDLVSKNVLAPEAERWIVVDFGGTSVMDEYLGKKTAGTFAEYAATTEAHNLTVALERKHKNFLNELSAKGISYECKYSYTSLMDGVAIKIKNRDFDTVQGMEGVSSAFYSEAYASPAAVDNNANAYASGIYDSSSVKGEPYNVQGEGMVVAILDTGIDHTHAAFQNYDEIAELDGIWTENTVKDHLANTAAATSTRGLSVDQVYYNAKIPFAYDYSDDDPIVFPSYSTHGTHVAGIVAGRDDSKYVNADKTQTFIGVAPMAQLMICKVFTDDPDSPMLGGADEVDIIAALSDCVEMGVDVINMSLGTSAGFSIPAEVDNVKNVYGKIEKAGISLVVAASNEYSAGTGGGYGTNLTTNPDSGTVGSPSTYSSALSVASIQGAKSRYFLVGATADETQAESVVMTECSDGHGNPYDFMQQLYDMTGEGGVLEDAVSQDGSLTLPYVVIGGVGRAQQYTSSIQRQLAQTPTIALVRRGDITFAEKVDYAKAAGAIACIIYNNVSGEIRMSLGDALDPIPTCSIGLDDGNLLLSNAKSGKGQITFSPSFQAGPFMSDFSSWGPTPDLKLKPEITAHGGEILSSVPGGYDTQSGTSMASPNMAGAVALLRQYVQKNHAGWTAVQVRDFTNQLLMSTATMALNEEGNPYSPRKQGAGLGGIKAAMDTEGYLTVKSIPGTTHITGESPDSDFDYDTFDKTGTTEAYRSSDAVVSDKVKVEFGDDPTRSGLYDMTFEVHNLKSYDVRYTPAFYVMTESLSSDGITVAEKARMLDPDIELYVNGEKRNTEEKISVPASGTVTVRVVISLSGKDRDYIESTFKNGMYVEGFVRLEAEGGSGNVSTVDLGIPFLAFYGDWTDSPIFDYTIYEIAASEQDKTIEEQDKLKAQAESTRPLGLYWDAQYVIPLGSYLYDVSPFDVELFPDEKKAAISTFDDTSSRSIYELYMISAGLMRNAKHLRITIRDTETGSLVYDSVRENVGKSYAMGGTVRGANVRLELRPTEWGLTGNTVYRLEMKAELDYPVAEGKQVPKDTFTFDFTVDTESPSFRDYRVRYEPYTDSANVTRYRIYLDVDVSDNQYVMDGMPCYLRDMEGEYEYEYDPETGRYTPHQAQQLSLLTEYPIPCYGGKGATSTLSFEITDYYDQMVRREGVFSDGVYFAIEDYAMNQSVYIFDITQAKGFTEDLVTLGEDNKLHFLETRTGARPDETPFTYNAYSLTIAQYESYNVVVNTTRDGVADPNLAGAVEVVTNGSSSLLATKGHEIFAFGSGGTETLDVVMDVPVSIGETQSTQRMVVAQIVVTVQGTPRAAPVPESVDLEPVFDAQMQYNTLSSNTLELNPGQEVTFEPTVSPWYCAYVNDYTYSYSVTNDVATVTAEGTLHAEKRGRTTLRVSVNGLARVTRSIVVNVNNEYDVDGYNLLHFYGDGEDGEVIVPERYNIMTMSEQAFQFNKTIRRVTLPFGLTQIPEEAFRGCENLEYVFIPQSVTFIGEAAFAGCANLSEVEFGLYTDEIDPSVTGVGAVALGRNCFRNCTSLETIVNAASIATAYDYAFSGCTSLREIDISGLRVAGTSVFGTAPGTRVGADGQVEYGWGLIEESEASGVVTVKTSEHTVLGPYMFRGCRSLAHVGTPKGGDEYVLEMPRFEEGVFEGCAALQNVAFGDQNVYYFGAYLFHGDPALSSITLPAGSYEVGASAFEGCETLTTVTLRENTEVLAFGRNAFRSCQALGAFAITGSNAHHSVDENHILYTAIEGGKRLDEVPVTFEGSVTLSADVKEIGAGAFARRNIDEFDAAALTEIGAYAFEGCTSLTSVTLPETMTVLNAGVFYGCTALDTINLDAVVTVDEYAFYGCSSLTGTLSLPVAENIYANAFNGTGYTSVSADALQGVGVRAFANTELTGAVSLPGTTLIDSFAFFGSNKITSVSLGAIARMGNFALAGMEGLKTLRSTASTPAVSLADGATTIGAYAFNGSYPARVSLPDSIRTIGAYAFAEPAYISGDATGHPESIGLRTLEIRGNGVATDLIVGDSAFENCYYLQIGADTLSGTVYIGRQAFMRDESRSGALRDARPLAASGTTLVIGADTIGAGAFINTGLTSIRLTSDADRTGNANGTGDSLILGTEAFRDNELTEVTIPAALCNTLFEDVQQYHSLNGKDLDRRGKYSATFGGGVFGANSSLRSINVEGDGVFFSEDGVLYSRAEDGFVLEQYPAGKVGTSYSVKVGTVRIAYGAFYGARNLTEVHIPYTVRTIGAYAFFLANNLVDYYFEGVDAPVLECPYADDVIFQTEEYYPLWQYGMYYSQFRDYWVTAAYYELGIVLHRPENGKGYDDLSVVWASYFNNGGDGAILTEYAADTNTKDTIAGIEGLPTAAEIRQAIDAIADAAAKRTEIGRISLEQVRPVRIKLNAITDARQLAFVSAELRSKFLAVEAEVRAIKAELGIPAALVSLDVTSLPKTEYFVGETFDPTGMTITAVYDDLSRLDVTDYTLSVTGALTEDDHEVVISYGGLTTVVRISVSPREGTDAEGGGGDDALYIALGVVGGVVVLGAAGAVAAVLLLKKKRAKAAGSEREAHSEEQSAEQPSEDASSTPEEKDTGKDE